MARSNPEGELQRALIEHLKIRARENCYWTHIVNRPIDARSGAILKKLGAKAGFPDLLFLCEGRFYVLELKAPGGKCSDSQLACHYDLAQAGAAGIAVADNIDAAIDILSGWNLIK